MKRILSFVCILVVIFSLTVASFAEASTSNTHGELLYNLGIVSGSSNTEMILDEDQLLTRQEMVAILNRLSLDDDSAFVVPTTPTFKDVPANHWAFKDVELAAHKGLTSGIGNGLFGLDEKINYNQAALFLARALKFDTSDIDYENAAAMIKADYNLSLEISTEGSKALERADIFELLNKSLTMKVNGKETTMIENLDFSEADKSSFLEKQANVIRYRTRLENEQEDTKDDATVDAGTFEYKLSVLPEFSKDEFHAQAMLHEYTTWIADADYNGEYIYDKSVKVTNDMTTFMHKYFKEDYTVLSKTDGMALLEKDSPSFNAVEVYEATSEWAKEQGMTVGAMENYNSLIFNNGELSLHVSSSEGIGGSSFTYEEMRQYKIKDGLTPYVIMLKEKAWGPKNEMEMVDAYFAFTVNSKGQIVESAGSTTYGKGYVKATIYE